jgi:hypothetical protein
VIWEPDGEGFRAEYGQLRAIIAKVGLAEGGTVTISVRIVSSGSHRSEETPLFLRVTSERLAEKLEELKEHVGRQLILRAASALDLGNERVSPTLAPEPPRSSGFYIISKRRGVRHKVDLHARVSFADGAPVPGRITNISNIGLFVAVESPPEVGAPVRVELIAGDDAVRGLVQGRVVRRVVAPMGAPMPSGVGIEVTRVDKEWTRLLATTAG